MYRTQYLYNASIDILGTIYYNKTIEMREKTRRQNPQPVTRTWATREKGLNNWHSHHIIEKEQNDMSSIEISEKIRALKEWEEVIAEAQAEAEAIKDSIKAEMSARQVEELEADTFIVRWTSVLSNRFDTTAFKKEHNDLYKQFTKQTTSRRFSIA